MIFISKYRKFKVGVRPTIKQILHSGSGSEELILHPGVTVEFDGAKFDTVNWEKYQVSCCAKHEKVISSEEDLIGLLRKNDYYNVDFFERQEETIEQRRAKLQLELSKLEAEEAVLKGGNSDNSPNSASGETLQRGTKPKTKTAGKAKKRPNRPTSGAPKAQAKDSPESKVDL